jgi:hypothetical protein
VSAFHHLMLMAQTAIPCVVNNVHGCSVEIQTGPGTTVPLYVYSAGGGYAVSGTTTSTLPTAVLAQESAPSGVNISDIIAIVALVVGGSGLVGLIGAIYSAGQTRAATEERLKDTEQKSLDSIAAHNELNKKVDGVIGTVTTLQEAARQLTIAGQQHTEYERQLRVLNEQVSKLHDVVDNIRDMGAQIAEVRTSNARFTEYIRNHQEWHRHRVVETGSSIDMDSFGEDAPPSPPPRRPRRPRDTS